MRVLIGMVIMLHGMVHLWFVVLSQELIPWQPEMGWTGRSWLLTNALGDATTRTIATVAYALATVAFVGSGIAFLSRAPWWRDLVVATALFSSLTMVVFWDGMTAQPVERGLLGLLLNIALIIGVLVTD